VIPSRKRETHVGVAATSTSGAVGESENSVFYCYDSLSASTEYLCPLVNRRLMVFDNPRAHAAKHELRVALHVGECASIPEKL
jgi:hypothetical protein